MKLRSGICLHLVPELCVVQLAIPGNTAVTFLLLCIPVLLDGSSSLHSSAVCIVNVFLIFMFT